MTNKKRGGYLNNDCTPRLSNQAASINPQP